MASSNSTSRSNAKAAKAAARARGKSGRPDDTAVRIRAYLASVRPWQEPLSDEIDEAARRGRSLIERIALSSDGDGPPTLRLTADQIADVLTFVRYIEPVDPDRWWHDAKISHLCGYGFVLDALVESLRECGEREQSAAPAPTTELPRALADYLDAQQRRAYGLQYLLEQLDKDDDLPACLGIAARAAHDLNEALDGNSIRRVLEVERLVPGVTLTAFPPGMKFQVIKAICGATGLSAAEAKERAENLPTTIRALVSDAALAEELEALGATVQVRS